MQLIFILIFIFIVLSVLGKIAKAAKTVNTTAKKHAAARSIRLTGWEKCSTRPPATRHG